MACKKSNGTRKSFHTFRLLVMITVAVTGFSRGKMTDTKVRMGPQPSMVAASSSSRGTAFRKPVYRKMTKGSVVAI
ncbi:hypothetical protein D3C72_2404150 [compost metagenome]